jgi:hypothetical protein
MDSLWGSLSAIQAGAVRALSDVKAGVVQAHAEFIEAEREAQRAGQESEAIAASIRLPWDDLYVPGADDDQLARARSYCREQVMKLSRTDRTFLEAPPADVDFVYDGEDPTVIARTQLLLQTDQRLQDARYRLVRPRAIAAGENSKTTEDLFWRAYMYRVGLVVELAIGSLRDEVGPNAARDAAAPDAAAPDAAAPDAAAPDAAAPDAPTAAATNAALMAEPPPPKHPGTRAAGKTARCLPSPPDGKSKHSGAVSAAAETSSVGAPSSVASTTSWELLSNGRNSPEGSQCSLDNEPADRGSRGNPSRASSASPTSMHGGDAGCDGDAGSAALEGLEDLGLEDILGDVGLETNDDDGAFASEDAIQGLLDVAGDAAEDAAALEKLKEELGIS